MLGRLRKNCKGLAKIVLAFVFASGLNLSIPSSLMATTPTDCHDSAIQSSVTGSSQSDSAELDADCADCPNSATVVEEPGSDSLYICAVMAVCGDDVRQSAVSAAEVNKKPGGWRSVLPLQGSVEPRVHRYLIQSTSDAPSRSLNIRYCRFLI
jgi:hypothetical protein